MSARRRVVEAPRGKRSAPQVESIVILVLPDEDPYLEDLDADMRAEYERGDFHFVGVRAEAEVIIGDVAQTIVSGGLWSIANNSGDDYFEEVAYEEYSDLRKILISIGVPTSQLPQKIERGWIQWRT